MVEFVMEYARNVAPENLEAFERTSSITGDSIKREVYQADGIWFVKWTHS